MQVRGFLTSHVDIIFTDFHSWIVFYHTDIMQFIHSFVLQVGI